MRERAREGERERGDKEREMVRGERERERGVEGVIERVRERDGRGGRRQRERW